MRGILDRIIFIKASLSIHIYYDGPSPAPGIFDEFLAIPNISSNISTRTYTSLVRAPNDNVTIGYTETLDSAVHAQGVGHMLSARTGKDTRQ